MRHALITIFANSVRNFKVLSLAVGCKSAAAGRVHDPEGRWEMVIKVEILYFEGCPNYSLAVERVREVLREEVSAIVSELNVSDVETAKQLGFLGSPSIRVNGSDVEPGARLCREYGIACRTYVTGDRREGAPSVETIRHAVLDAWAGAPESAN
jgi:hypothetical protein